MPDGKAAGTWPQAACVSRACLPLFFSWQADAIHGANQSHLFAFYLLFCFLLLFSPPKELRWWSQTSRLFPFQFLNEYLLQRKHRKQLFIFCNLCFLGVIRHYAESRAVVTLRSTWVTREGCSFYGAFPETPTRLILCETKWKKAGIIVALFLAWKTELWVLGTRKLEMKITTINLTLSRIQRFPKLYIYLFWAIN